jgi:sulfur carrier protein ThiS
MKMKIRAYNLVVLAFVLFMAVIAPKARADSGISLEYQVKAAFLYNFIKFVNWPKEKFAVAVNGQLIAEYVTLIWR